MIFLNLFGTKTPAFEANDEINRWIEGGSVCN